MANTKSGGQKRWLDGFPAWVAACSAVHGGKYSYENAQVRVHDGVDWKVSITCPDHGPFMQNPAKHKFGQKCPSCSGNVLREPLQYLQAKFPEQEFPTPWSYRSKDKVQIVCKDHGPFTATFNQLQQKPEGSPACPSCCRSRNSGVRLGKDEIEARLLAQFPNYEFYLTDETVTNGKVVYVCPDHGANSARVADLILGHGCPACGNLARKVAVSEVVGKSHDQNHAHVMSVHEGKIVPLSDNMLGTHRKYKFACAKHGEFESRLYTVKAGHGCPTCSHHASQGERAIAEWLEAHGVEVVRRDRSVLACMELDIVLPEFKLAIEFCGLYWHGEAFKSRTYHADKRQACLNAGFQLITVFEDEWSAKPELVKSVIASRIGKRAGSIGARSCEVVHVSWAQASAFYEQHHLQGAGSPCADNVALIREGKIVACMSFKVTRFGVGDVELMRFATSENVPGAFSRLFSAHAKNLASGTKIVSYCDLRWFTGKTYESAGFVFDGESAPGYWWCKKSRRHSRAGFQKHKLAKKLDKFDVNMSESENLRANKYWKIWDCGAARYVRIV